MFEDRRTSDVLPSLTAAVAWGAMFPVAASAIHHVDAFHLTAVRYLIATAIFLGLLALIEGGRALLPQGRALELFVLGTLGFAGFNLFTYLALEHVRPQDASLIVATSPLLTVFAVWLTTRQKPNRTTFAAMLVALFGVMLVITHGDPSALGGSAGDLLVLAGVASFVAYTTGARRFADFSPLRYTALSAVGGTLTILAVTAILTLTGTYAMPSAAQWGDAAPQTVYIILAGAVIGVLAWNEGVRRIGAANGALFMNLVPVVTFAVEIGRGYRPGEFEILGALLTIAALVFANLAARAKTVAVPARAAVSES